MESDLKTTTAPAVAGAAAELPRGARRLLLRTTGIITRAMMLVAVVATFISSMALLVFGGVETYHFVETLIFDSASLGRAGGLLLAVEIVDIFLVATVVQVVSLGLYQLYFDQQTQLPAWLRVGTLDDLKIKLVGVTVTVLGVFFLGEAISWTGETAILYLGVAVAAVIGGLTYFYGKVVKLDKDSGA